MGLPVLQQGVLLTCPVHCDRQEVLCAMVMVGWPPYACCWCDILMCMQVLEEEEEEQVLSWPGCFVWLALVTLFISILSDYIMDAITGTRRALRAQQAWQGPHCSWIIPLVLHHPCQHAFVGVTGQGPAAA